MGFNIQFNARTIEPNMPLAPVPTGEYPVIIVSTDEKPTQKGGGATFYEIVMQIIDGEYKGRRVIDRLNCKNPNDQARDIAYATLSSICYVTGVIQLQNSSAELHGKPFKVSVAKVPRSDDPTKEGNEIRGYMDISGNTPDIVKKMYDGGGASSSGQTSGFGSNAETSNGISSSFGGTGDTGASSQSGDTSTSDDSGDIPPRVIDLMVEQNLEYEAAVQAYELELAAANSPKESPADAAKRKAAEAAKAKAAAAANASKNASAGTGGGAVPDWAQG